MCWSTATPRSSVCEDQEQVDKVLEKHAELPRLKRIV